MRVLVLGSLGPNHDRIGALCTRVQGVVYAYSEFHPTIVRLENALACVPLARRNLVAQLRYLLVRHDITVVYSLLNAADGSTEATQELLDDHAGVPVVRHYKEHPCVPTLEERRVLLESDGQIYINEASYDYFRNVYGVRPESAHLMDADMIAEGYMTDDFMPKRRLEDGQPHLLVAGGMSTSNDRLDVRELCVEMDRRGVHVHLYGYMVGKDQDGTTRVGDSGTREAYEKLAAGLTYMHLHDYVQPPQFCREWSVYDAGFMHPRVHPHSTEAPFEEMNMPYRYTAYLAAGLPLIVPQVGQRAMRALVENAEVGVAYADYNDLADALYDEEQMGILSMKVRRRRHEFSFDHSADALVDILHKYSC